MFLIKNVYTVNVTEENNYVILIKIAPLVMRTIGKSYITLIKNIMGIPDRE